MSDVTTSPAYIESLARNLIAVTKEAEQAKADYEFKLQNLANYQRWLSKALKETGVTKPVSIAPDGSESLVCICNGEGGYSFSVVSPLN